MAGYQGTSTRQNDGESMAALVEAERRDMHTNLPGKAVSYDGKHVSVTPALTQTFGDKELKAPTLEKVPVMHLRGAKHGVHIPIGSGDPMTIFFSSRSRDAFQIEGSDIDNSPRRLNDLSDGIAFPGVYPDDNPFTGIDPSHFHAGSDDGKKGIRARPDGSVALVGGDGSDKVPVTPDGRVDLRSNNDSLMEIMIRFLEIVWAHTNGGAVLDEPFRTQIKELKNRVEAMKA